MTWAPLIGSLLARPQRAAIGADERALLDAVIAEPDEDGPRFVYADWLQQRGDVARGELIAVQCALARLDHVAEHNRLKARDFELVERHGNAWCVEVGLGEFRNNWHPSVWAADFQRGFIEEVEIPTVAFAGIVPRLFSLEPVRALRLIGNSDVLHRLPESVYLRRLHSFGLRNCRIDDEVLAAIIDATSMSRLQLENVWVDRLAVGAICRSQVRELTLPAMEADGTVYTLLRSAPQLEVLVLDGSQISDAAALAIASGELKLRRLSLRNIELGAATRERLVARFGAVLEL